jgi:hypothetical protein
MHSNISLILCSIPRPYRITVRPPFVPTGRVSIFTSVHRLWYCTGIRISKRNMPLLHLFSILIIGSMKVLQLPKLHLLLFQLLLVDCLGHVYAFVKNDWR